MRKIFASIKTGAWAIRQVFVSAPLEASFLLLFVILQGLIPAASLYVIQGIIEWVSSTATFPFFYVSLWGGMLLGDIVLTPVNSVVRLHLNEKMLTHCNLLLMRKANTIQGLTSFENPKIYDEIQFLKGQSATRPLNLIYVVSGFIKEAIALISVFVVLFSVSWWIPVTMFLACFPHAMSTLWFEKQSWDQMFFRSPQARRLAWISSQTLDERSAKELRLFGFGDFLVQRYKRLAKTMHQTLSFERWKKSGLAVLLSSITVLGNLLIISFILYYAKEGALKIGSLVITIQALVMTQSQLIGCTSYLGMSTPILLFFSKFHHFLSSTICPISMPDIPQKAKFLHEIEFHNVSFAYPDGREVLSDVSFKLRSGEKIAIVGENGAGKSTLVKLILRFYDPSKGKITVDGVDLKHLDVIRWRELISAVFQDFGQYHFTIGENIALGDIEASTDKIYSAAEKGGFAPTLKKVSLGLETQLGKEFGGTSLSGGEWQKLAMSRAFVRSASLLILDEPTSALDPKSEAEVFTKFAEAAQGVTTLLITHRLGSVKMADRILVFKEGRLVEEGSHLNLLREESVYSKLFKLQASQYSQKDAFL